MVMQWGGWVRRWLRQKRARRSGRLDPETLERIRLVMEIREAQRNWEHAQMRLDYVADADQIDYAIYSLEAAEKRYEMLLRQAKHMRLSLRGENGEWLDVEEVEA